MSQTRYIFVTGGVLSGLGKGIAAASLGNILKAKGFNVGLQKCDPYLNVDAGTLNPGEHGEVFVTADGAETDLDVGHYERFTNTSYTKESSLMSGYVYSRVLVAERKGEYLGKTVQIIPHVVAEIHRLIVKAGQKYDIHIVEIGGTVGDYEALHFLEAIRQMRRKVGEENVLYAHLVFLPYLETSKELKTKPAQNSVRDLRSLGIHPDIIFCRADHHIGKNLLEKISLFCDVPIEAVVPLETSENVYDVPLILEHYRAGDYVCEKLRLKNKKADLVNWLKFLEKSKGLSKTVNIGLVAKYLANHDTYKSIMEGLKISGWYAGVDVKIHWIDAEKINGADDLKMLEGLDGILVPGGFGERGIGGKILAAQYARQNKIPYFGICLGMQVLVIEFARNVCGLAKANSAEFDGSSPYPVIDLMAEQKDVTQKGGTMRLGSYPCVLDKKSLSFAAYGAQKIEERHRHRFEFNNNFKDLLEENGLVIAGISPDNKLVEIVEVRDHPFMVGAQFHPEFRARPLAPHPLFQGFIQAAKIRINTNSQINKK